MHILHLTSSLTLMFLGREDNVAVTREGVQGRGPHIQIHGHMHRMKYAFESVFV